PKSVNRSGAALRSRRRDRTCHVNRVDVQLRGNIHLDGVAVRAVCSSTYRRGCITATARGAVNLNPRATRTVELGMAILGGNNAKILRTNRLPTRRTRRCCSTTVVLRFSGAAPERAPSPYRDVIDCVAVTDHSDEGSDRVRRHPSTSPDRAQPWRD